MNGSPVRGLSVVDELAAALRARILDGELGPGEPLRELELASAYDVSRHTLRAALRSLSSQGLVRLERNRGATVAQLSEDDLRDLFELRTALELEAAQLALERHDGRLPGTVHAALNHLVERSLRSRPSWQSVADAHAGLHLAIVAASESARIVSAYEQLSAELTLFLVQLRPVWSLERMRAHHEALVAGLEREGAPALRVHLREGIDSVLADRA
jgi:DNA-binding GntR family transcriptional regulator